LLKGWEGCRLSSRKRLGICALSKRLVKINAVVRDNCVAAPRQCKHIAEVFNRVVAEMPLQLTRRRRRAKFIRYAASSFTLAEKRSGAALNLALTSTASQIPTELNRRQSMENRPRLSPNVCYYVAIIYFWAFIDSRADLISFTSASCDFNIFPTS